MTRLDHWRGPLAVLTLLAAVGTIYGVSSKNVRAREAAAFHRAAVEALERGNPREAIRALHDGINCDPGNAELHLALAMAYSHHKQEAAEYLGLTAAELYPEMMEELKTACSLEPENVEMARIRSLFSLNAELFGAETNLNMAYEAWRAYLDAYETNIARTRAQTAINDHRKYGILMRLAQIEFERGNLDSAKQCAWAAVSLNLPKYLLNEGYAEDVFSLLETE